MADGTTQTISNTLIADTCKSQICIVTRACDLYFSAIEIGGFSSIEIPGMNEGEDPEPEPDTVTDITNPFSASAADETNGANVADSALKDYFTLDLRQGGCTVSDGKYHMTAINGIHTDMNGKYFVTLKDHSTAGATGRMWVVVRGYYSVTTNSTINGYYNDDDNKQLGHSGIYTRIQDGKLYIMLKFYNPSRPNRISNKTFVIDCEGDDLTVADDGNTVYILVDGKTYATIQLNGTANYADATSTAGGFAAEAVVTLADGTTQTISNTLIADTYKSQICIVTRACDLYFSAIEIGGFSSIEIPSVSVKE